MYEHNVVERCPILEIELPSPHIRVQLFSEKDVCNVFVYVLLFHGDDDFRILYIFNGNCDILGSVHLQTA